MQSDTNFQADAVCLQNSESRGIATGQCLLKKLLGNGEILLFIADFDNHNNIKDRVAICVPEIKGIIEYISLHVLHQTNTGCFVLCRFSCPAATIELRVAMCGNVDSGKSTLTSVLTRFRFDDGRGYARKCIFRHVHEAESGRTSDVSEHYLGFSESGSRVSFYASESSEDVIKSCRKTLTFVDLAGHEKYLRTTVTGMAQAWPDYAILCISSNNGVQKMTKEHLALCLAARIPFIVVITRIDATPESIRATTIAYVQKMLKLPKVRMFPYLVKDVNDVYQLINGMELQRVVPIVEVSNVTGENIDILSELLNLMPCRNLWSEREVCNKQSQLLKDIADNFSFTPPSINEMVVHNTYSVPGVGTVVGGIIRKGIFSLTSGIVYLGPDKSGYFRATQLKSIYSKGYEVAEVYSGSDVTMALKKEKRASVRKGMVILSGADAFKCAVSYWSFECELVVFYHSTTIALNYEPVIHTSTARQVARLEHIEGSDTLRSGCKAIVRFSFRYRPEYICVSDKVILREGRTKGFGTITKLINVVKPLVTKH